MRESSSDRCFVRTDGGGIACNFFLPYDTEGSRQVANEELRTIVRKTSYSIVQRDVERCETRTGGELECKKGIEVTSFVWPGRGERAAAKL
jgi:hypothetical protein